ncbi:MAG: YIP1 family protein [candidate division KSB1 bacterium]|nr:YIP1 family protein [candidate division KSB1 bacterium]
MPEETQKELGVFQKIVGVFSSPRQTFESVNRKPDWVVPLVIVLLVSLVISILVTPIAMQEGLEMQREMMKERGMSDEQIDNALAIGQKVGKITGPIMAVIVILVVLLIVAAVLMFGGNVILGGTTNFKKVFSVICYSSLIGSLGGLIKLPLMLSKQSVKVSFSLATFLSEDASKTFLYKLLSKIELFTIWELAVLSIGLAVIYKFTTKKAATLVVSLWIIWVVISVGLGSLLGGRFGF